MKRDAFNGRALGRHAQHPEWSALVHLSGGLAERLLALEAEAAQLDAKFGRSYELERERERRHLFGHLADVRFLRGVALSSPELVDRALALGRRPPGRFDRRERKVEQSLLRFVTRAAAKLSPYSTLTAFTLGAVSETAGLGGLTLEASRRELSLVRVSRPVLETLLALLLRHPRVRARCLLSLNDTAEEIAPGRYRLLRPGSWRLDSDLCLLRYEPPAQVRATLNSDLVQPLRRLLAAGPALYAEVIRELSEARDATETEAETGGEIDARVERLLAVGFVQLLPPWPTSEPRLEESLLSLLRALTAEPAPSQATAESLDVVNQALQRLVHLELGFASAEHPERAVRTIVSAIDELAAAVGGATGTEPHRGAQDAQLLHEDVLLMPVAADNGEEAALRISPQRAGAIMGCAELVSAFASLYNHRHDFLHSLAALWSARWPARRTIPLLELFWEAQPLWREYLRFDAQHRFRTFSSFNPSSLASIDGLNRLRERTFSDAQAAMREGALGRHLAPARLAALVDQVPDRYRPLLGCSVFVQPADPEGRLWVLNRLFEGTGRYLSRYGAAFDEAARSRYSDHFRQRSVVEIDGEEVELLDLVFSSLITTNAHAPQTRRVLQTPGEHVGISASGRVLLSELQVSADLARETFRIVDSRGRRLLPVHLSSLSNLHLPSILRFLSAFGPFEVRQVFPRPADAGTGVSERLTCGPLVLRRRRWELEVSSLEVNEAPEPSLAIFRQIHRWRESAGLPRQVFVYEPLLESDGTLHCFKPQYLDFSSPSFAGVFLSILRKASGRLIFEEALPAFTDFPIDSSGTPRAIEIQIDSLALGLSPTRGEPSGLSLIPPEGTVEMTSSVPSIQGG